MILGAILSGGNAMGLAKKLAEREEKRREKEENDAS